MTSTSLLELFAVLLVIILIALTITFWDWLYPSLACTALQYNASPELVAFVFETLGLPEPMSEAERSAERAQPHSHAESQLHPLPLPYPHLSHPYWADLTEPHLAHFRYRDFAVRTAIAASLLSARDPSE
jgi:hypothetical protein